MNDNTNLDNRTWKSRGLFVLWTLTMLLTVGAVFAQFPANSANSAGNSGSAVESTVESTVDSQAQTPFTGPEHTYKMKKGMAINGIVVYVADGDTFNLKLDDGVVIVVRAQAIDAPEKRQDHGNISKEFLRRELLDRRVTLYYDKTDSYNRYVGRIYRNGLDMEELMLRRGHAWHFKQYNDEPQLAQVEAEARARGIGLWKEFYDNDPKNDPIPPWDYRKRRMGDYAVKPKPIGIPVQEGEQFWLSKSGTLHNESCENFNNTQNGRFASPNEGRDCKRCGGSRRNLQK